MSTTFPMPRIDVIDDQVLLFGHLTLPVLLSPSLTQREQLARDHISQALAGDQQVVPFFFGIEHVQALKDWPKDRSCVVICSSKMRFEAEQRRPNHRLADLPAHCHLIVGDWGFYHQQHMIMLRPTFFSQEVGLLSYQLMALPDELFAQVKIFKLPTVEAEAVVETQLERAVHAVTLAKRFHAEHEPLYQRLRKNYVEQGDHRRILALSNSKGKPEAQIEWLNFLKKDHDVHGYQLMGEEDDVTKNHFLPPIADSLWQEDLTRPGYPEFLGAKDFLKTLEKINPRFVCWRNRAPFLNLEHLLYYEEILRRLEIPTKQFFSDWFCQQSQTFEGGWHYDLFCDLGRFPKTTLYSLYPQEAGLYANRHHPVYLYPFDYTGRKKQIEPPLESPEQMKRDVAIVHSMRAFCYKSLDINNMHHMVTEDSVVGPEKSAVAFLYRLRQLVSQAGSVFSGSYYLKNQINYIDFFFYNMSRMKSVIAAVNALQDLRVTVYGEGWHNMIPAEFCHPFISTADLEEVHRTSLCTIDLSRTFSQRTPHFTGIQCLRVGGLPLFQDPVLSAESAHGVACFNRKNLLFFSGVDDLQNQILRFKNDWSLRQNYIHEAQKTWFTDLHSGRGDVGFEENPTNPCVFAGEPPTKITDNPEVDESIALAGFGYIMKMNDYLEVAAKIWDQVLVTRGYVRPFLLGDAMRVHAVLKDWKAVARLIKLGDQTYPKHPYLLRVMEEIKQLMASLAKQTAAVL